MLELLEDEFAISERSVLFDGEAGFYIYLRDEHIQGLSPNERNSIYRFVQGNIEVENLIKPTTSPTADNLDTTEWKQISGGRLGDRVRTRCREIATRVKTGEKTAVSRALSGELEEIDEIDTSEVRKALSCIKRRPALFRQGIVNQADAVLSLGKALIQQTLDEIAVSIDQSQTALNNALFPAPEILHPMTGYKLTRVSMSDLPAFDPQTAAVPEWDTIDGLPERIPVRLPESEQRVEQLSEHVSGDPTPGGIVELPPTVAYQSLVDGVVEPS
jgi:DNA primase catalytic subunit